MLIRILSIFFTIQIITVFAQDIDRIEERNREIMSFFSDNGIQSYSFIRIDSAFENGDWRVSRDSIAYGWPNYYYRLVESSGRFPVAFHWDGKHYTENDRSSAFGIPEIYKDPMLFYKPFELVELNETCRAYHSGNNLICECLYVEKEKKYTFNVQMQLIKMEMTYFKNIEFNSTIEFLNHKSFDGFTFPQQVVLTIESEVFIYQKSEIISLNFYRESLFDY